MRTFHPVSAQIPRFFGPLLLAVTLCSCNLLIPENPSSPRYNSVLGQPRTPQLNPAGGPGPSSNAAPMMQQAEAPEVNATAFPPVDPATEARAREIMASDVPPPPMAAPQQNARQMPLENQPGMQVAGNYPELNNVPATPPMGANGDAARLARVRAQLEAERNGADAARNQLATDAAAEPSLLDAPMPQAPLSPQSSIGNGPGYIAQLPPPPPPLAQAGGTTWDRNPSIASAPLSAPSAQTASVEPILLRAPGAQAQPAPSFGFASAAPAPEMSMAPAMAGGFNPMAGSEPITLRAPTNYAGGTSYLPDSRYATRRN